MEERQEEEIDRLSVPRKKRRMKCQARQMPSSIDVLAEILAERCGEDADDSTPDIKVCKDGDNDFRGGSDEDAEDDEDGGSEDYDEEEDEKNFQPRSVNRSSEDKAKKRALEPYKFTRCKLRNRHFLKEGQGLAMIRGLGLEQFLLHTEVPRFNKSYCTEFISSYSHSKGAGVVNGRLIKITAQAVEKLTGLPLGNRGERAVVHDVRGEDLPVMDKLIPGLKRTSYGYDLRYLRYRDQTETFVAVASALSEKLVCRTFKLTYIKGAIILAMETSLRLKILMQWADFMAETIKSAIKLTKMRTRNVRFAFGEWLTGMIENALDEEEGEEEKSMEKGSMEASLPEKEETMENDAALLLNAAAAPPESVVPAIEAPEPREPLPLVALTPHKFKKRVRTATIPVMAAPTSASDCSGDEVKRLRQQLADAERREKWYVATNLNMARELERLKLELESIRGSQSADKDGEPRVSEEKGKEMQIVLKGSTRNTEEAQVDRVIERLEQRSLVHEQEVSRLKQEVEEQRKVIELIKRSRGVVAPPEPMDRREEKRLRRE